MVGGGLMQLIAYGAQDYMLTSGSFSFYRHGEKPLENVHDVDDCRYNVINIGRKYKNFQIIQLSWYCYGNASFTSIKYKQLTEECNNSQYVTVDVSNLSFKIENGEQRMLEKLKEQKELSKKCRERNKEITIENEKAKKTEKKDQEIIIEEIKQRRKRQKKAPRHHKRFFYAK